MGTQLVMGMLLSSNINHNRNILGNRQARGNIQLDDHTTYYHIYIESIINKQFKHLQLRSGFIFILSLLNQFMDPFIHLFCH